MEIDPLDVKLKKSCCVAECKDRTSRRHMFPKKYPEFFKLWVDRIKPKDYNVLSADEIYQKYRVCDKHFHPSDIVNEKRGIRATAIPCLRIPGFSEMDNSTSSENKQQHQTPIIIIDDPKPVTTFEQKITLQPFAKMSFGGPNKNQASTNTTISSLEEQEIKIEHTNIPSLKDPLLVTYPNKNKSPMQPKIIVGVPQRTKKAIIKEIKTVSAGQAEILKKLQFTPQLLTKVATPKSATVANSTTTPIKKTPPLLLPTLKLKVQVPPTTKPVIKINAAPPSKNKVAVTTAQPVIKVINAQAAKPNVQVATPAVVASPQSMFKFRIQTTPNLKLTKTTKPQILNTNVAVATNAQVSSKVKAETVDLTLDDDEDQPITKNSNDDSTLERPQNEIIIVQEIEERYKTSEKTNFLCKICKTNKCGPYFCVPSSTRALNIWKFCLGDPSVTSSDVVCAAHFIKEDYLEVPPDNNNLGKLKPHVVPTPKGHIRHGCIIPSCINRYKTSPNMYSVPVWTNYTPWLKLIRQYVTYTKLSDLLQYRVCDRHFDVVTEENMFYLKPNQNVTIEQELDKYMEKRNKLQILLGNQLGGVCTYLTCRRELYSGSFKFPDDYKEAYYWLTLCKRSDILLRNGNEIKEYLKSSQGLCAEHYNQIKAKAALTFKNDRPASDDETSNKSSDDQIITTLKQANIVPEEITYVPIKSYCSFINCSSHIKTAAKKFRFPSNQELLKKWQKACGIEDFVNLNHFSNLFVCGKHFKPGQYSDRGTLKKDSVPESHLNYFDPLAVATNLHWNRKSSMTKKIFAPKTDTIQSAIKQTCSYVTQPSTSTVFDNDGPSADKRRKVEVVSGRKCCVTHCTSDDKTVLFGFSNLSRHIRELWIKGVENRANITIDKNNHYLGKFLCLNHFEEQYRINDTELVDNAIPTLGLIDDSVLKVEPDTSIEWVKQENDTEMNELISSNTAVRSKVILQENGLEFWTMKRTLKFGEDCPKKGVNKFPYNVHRMHNQQFKLQQENIRHGHPLQMHTAIIIDDDDESEKKTLEMICKVLWANQPPQRRRRACKPI